MRKFNNQYRIPSARLPHWDYSTAGVYFITICTHNRTHYFGKCQDGTMILSTVGAIVQGFWYEIPKHFSFVELGAFVVMPNHIHGILMLSPPVETLHCNVSNNQTGINENVSMRDDDDGETLHCNVSNTNTGINENISMRDDDGGETLHCNVSTGNDKSEFYQKISPKSGSISTIIRSFKSVCTKHIHQTFPDLNFEWQTRFWNNIITNNNSFENVSQYIVNNPKNWDKDRFFDAI